MKKILALALALLMSVSLFACGGGAADTTGGGAATTGSGTTSGGSGGLITFTYARAEDIQNWDIFNQNNIVNLWAQYLIYNTLVTNDYSGSFQPSLATEWSTSADGLAWTFKLRTGVKFHNGEDFTSDDVKTTFDRIIDDQALIRAALFTAFESIECPDDNTVVFKLKTPMGNLLTLLSTYPVCPGDLWREKGVDMFQLNIGTGPWKYVSWDPGQEIVFEKNTEYWGGVVSNVDRIVYKNITEDTTRVAGLRTGDLDFVDSIPVDQKSLLAGEGFTVDEVLSTDQLLIGYRTVDSIFSDINARKAVSHAIDREALVTSILGAGRPASWPVGVGVMGFDENSPVPEYNVDLAKDFLGKTSYNGEEINLIGPIGNYTRISEVLQACTSMLMEAGFNVKLEMLEGAAFQQRRQEGKYDIYITGCSHGAGDPGTNLTQRWVGDSLNSGWKDPVMNGLIEQSNAESDPAKRVQLIHDALAMGWGNLAPWGAIYQMDYTCAYATHVSGVVIHGDKMVDASRVMINK